jgi:DNA-binding response OmpR family regulator
MGAFYAHLRQQVPALCQRVLFLVEDSNAANHQAFLAQCGRPWLEKPCPIAELRSAIAQVLERAARAPQLSRTCQALRQRNQALLGTVHPLRARSVRLQRQAALLHREGWSAAQPLARDASRAAVMLARGTSGQRSSPAPPRSPRSPHLHGRRESPAQYRGPGPCRPA